ncbi:MAG TPA: hypothetical protein HA282_05590 [Nanoarchaeota archaeon]|nr:MAG: hypothetical protein QT01_C0001G0110 [archaeon GW2011_AR6]MBS3082558.1 hypothetical protein [Candidatus Pacearchaeota archaeon]HIH17481.1 hypothetical protein [Nanoarchaeota archaeon]HIH33936.1 hypothetical protein [Nanoarchaeota archaeon]HIH51773.1 hypothetical protein [Nanoarchaeota archaeon]
MKLRPLNDKRGVEISTNTIIIVIIALLVLVISAAFFAGGMAQLVGKIKEIFYRPGTASEDVVKAQCESLCQTRSGIAFCKEIKITGKEGGFNCPGLGVKCQFIECTGETPKIIPE